MVMARAKAATSAPLITADQASPGDKRSKDSPVTFGDGMAISSEGLSAEYQEPVGPAGVRLRDRPRAALQRGNAAVAIRAAGLNHLDLWLAHGAQRIDPPRVICADGAGVVEESAGGRWNVGDEVVLLPTIS